MKAKKQLTVNDLVAPGDILQLLRDTLDKASTLKSIIIITDDTTGKGPEYAFAGLDDEYQAVGHLEKVKLQLLLEAEDNG